MQFAWFVTVSALLLSSQSHYTDGATVLLLPSAPLKTDWLPRLGAELTTLGYKVYTVTRENGDTKRDYQNAGVEILSYKIDNTEISEAEYDERWKDFTTNMVEQSCKAPMDAQLYFMRVQQGTELLAKEGDSLFKDKALWDQLKELKLDLIFIEGSVWTPYLYIIPYKLGVPFVSSSYFWDEYRMRLPHLPSFSPASYLPLTDQMNFPQRLKNFIFALLSPRIESVSFKPSDVLLRKYGTEKPAMLMRDLQRMSKLWFVDAAPSIDYPRITLPNVIITNGLSVQNSKKLPTKIQDFIALAQDGVILFSIETFPGTVLPNKHLEIFNSVFRNLSYSVIYQGNENDILENVINLPKAPLNDVLGDINTKLFISNCDNSALYMAVYHCVPVICIPLYGLQHYNARKVQEKGYGMVVEMHSLTHEHLLKGITTLLNTSSYKNKIMKASAIIKSEPWPPLKRVAFWVDHVIQHGADHLNSAATDMPWYSLYSVDVILFFAVMVLLAAAVSLITAYRLTCRVYRYFELDKDKSD